MHRLRRRDFLRGLGASIAAGSAGLSTLQSLAPALAATDELGPSTVRFGPDMEPVVRWIESTPRNRIFETAVEKLRAGLSYRRFLGGLFLAGIRNIKPRPVGFKFHAVMVIESAHQLALDAPASDRLIPLFWALDNFKGSQEADVRDGDWTLPPAREGSLPAPGQAKKAFVDAMEKWDEEAADAAVTALCRSAEPSEVLETLWPYGARDWENIGHKIIFTAHAARTLETIGWRHAEPVLRSLVYGILNGGNDDSAAPYARNLELAGKARKDWAAGREDPGATAALLEVLREAKAEDASRAVLDALEKGVAPASLWDGALLAAGELLLRKPGIVALHAITSTNSLHHAFRSSASDATRLLVLLQAASWITFYREAIRGRGGLPDGPRLDRLEAAAAPPPLEEVLQGLSKDPVAAARGVLAHGDWAADPAPFMDAARRLVFQKGTDSHDFKFAAAAFEEVLRATPASRSRLLAASVASLKSSSDSDSPLLEKTRAAIARL